jgi:hypothetical protein
LLYQGIQVSFKQFEFWTKNFLIFL